MNPRERVWAALERRPVDRIPRCEVWIDALQAELGEADPSLIYRHLEQDWVLLPTVQPAQSRAWQEGTDEWGRIWRAGMYAGGALSDREALERYSPPLGRVTDYFDPTQIDRVRTACPNRCLMFGTHIGPFTAAYLAMGPERFFIQLMEAPGLVQELLERRTDWCIAMYRRALALGAEVLVLGDDAGTGRGPMISPAMWREFVLPLHRRIVRALPAPVIWHSDGNIEDLLPMAVEAGFAGIHGLDPSAGMDLARIGRRYGERLILAGNLDVRVLFGENLQAVRDEVDRCMEQCGSGRGYLFATCNSISTGMNPDAVREMMVIPRQPGR